ncbi:hypothetical protein PV08_05550 [Exophiala spinifera]|uniref:Uncharacterized protein n=1 Tax=Exophiala spinifera TaxID=91928 RepID=A0A0D2BWA6_9EURO|nr:uncharacterized protein PV08_05550 [Exophiala spinifera]KIW15504.1 hypothetical protein PV08_05550 [Exophiala spinifera]
MSTNYLITGANRGLGRGFVSTYLSRPNSVVIAAVRNPSEECVKDLQSLPKAPSSSLIVVKIDSSSETDAAAAVKQIQDEHKIASLDVVIANAGTSGSIARVEALTPSDLVETFKINAVGPVLLFSAVAPLLKQSQSKPRFVTITSCLGTIGNMEEYPFPASSYGMSKAALNFATKKIHQENEHLIAFPMHPGWVYLVFSPSFLSLLAASKHDASIHLCGLPVSVVEATC